MINNITPAMVEHLNLKLKDMGSCLRYKEGLKDTYTTNYELVVEDQFISFKYGCSINYT